MKKKNRQEKALKVIMTASRRMLANMLDINPLQIKNRKLFNNEEACAAIRELYQIHQEQPDRLTKAYDLADLVR
jgi:hypothetical protein